jgi:hypothetical protein
VLSARRLDLHAGARCDERLLHPEGEQLANAGKRAIRLDRRTAVSDAVEQRDNFDPLNLAGLAPAPSRQHVLSQHPLVLAPRALFHLRVARDIEGGELAHRDRLEPGLAVRRLQGARGDALSVRGLRLGVERPSRPALESARLDSPTACAQ